MYLLKGWKGSREKEHDSGVNAKPRWNVLRSQKQACSWTGAPCGVNRQLPIHTKPPSVNMNLTPWLETEKHMTSTDLGKCSEFLTSTIKIQYSPRFEHLLLQTENSPYSRSYCKGQFFWAALIRVWRCAEDVLQPLVSQLWGIYH